MNRTIVFKLLYAVVILVGVGIVVTARRLLGLPTVWLIVVALLLFVPGRVQGYYWRDFFRGRRLLANGRADESIPYFQSFLQTLRDHPRLKRLIWLSWGMYSRDIEVMTLNNVGAARLCLGNLDAAEADLHAAIALDPAAPLPYVNMGRLRQARVQEAEANVLFVKARALGYKGSVVDKLIHVGGTTLARVEGRGIKRANGSSDV